MKKRVLDAVPNPRILSILPTLQCTAACQHCGTFSHPRLKGRLAKDVAKRLIREASELAYDSVVFTGGEPTLYGHELDELIAFASSLSLPTRMVTNGHWASTPERAVAMVHRLKAAGLNEINFSTGDAHVQFVPLDRIYRGLRAVLDGGLTVAVMIEVVHGNAISRASLMADPAFTARITPAEARSIVFTESPWMPLDPDDISTYPPGLMTNTGNIASRLGCDSVINTTTILADGKIMACCGLGAREIPELEIGHSSRDSLQTTRRLAEGDFLKRWIRNEGPERILQWAAGKNDAIKWEDQYAHRCQACKRLYSDPLVRETIRNHHEEKILDVLYSEWVLHSQEQLSDRDGELAAGSAPSRP